MVRLQGKPSSGGYLLVADKEKDTLFLINAQTLEIENSVAVGRGPHEVAVAPALGRAYVSNYKGGVTISIKVIPGLTSVSHHHTQSVLQKL